MAKLVETVEEVLAAGDGGLVLTGLVVHFLKRDQGVHWSQRRDLGHRGVAGLLARALDGKAFPATTFCLYRPA
jgi:hypothetical protein